MSLGWGTVQYMLIVLVIWADYFKHYSKRNSGAYKPGEGGEGGGWGAAPKPLLQIHYLNMTASFSKTMTADTYNISCISGLCSKDARVPQATNFCFGRPDRLFSCKLYAGHPGSHALETLGS